VTPDGEALDGRAAPTQLIRHSRQEGRMGRKFDELSERHIAFIGEQKMFFVATAPPDGRISLSPKGMGSFRVLGPNRALWLNVTGSGNETAAHVQLDPRMTVMFCAFEGAPVILRLYGEARAVHRQDADWPELFALFNPLPGARQIFDLTIELVQTSCGFGVPLYAYEGERGQMEAWAVAQGEEGLKAYWAEKNAVTIDGLPTNLIEKTFGPEG
jgi:hypothetical protein